ncbi:hypothetical protein ACPCAE_18850 [Streptomyces cinereoruber]|uniref:hypothetical protein n=1 Tax=Streptomyces cinereoruber TaxID=67260 RepID=UPI003C2DB38C
MNDVAAADGAYAAHSRDARGRLRHYTVARRLPDVGCGDGETPLLVAAGRRVNTLCSSSGVLRGAAERVAAGARVREAPVFVRCICVPPFAGTKCGAVCCHGVLMYLDEPVGAVARLAVLVTPARRPYPSALPFRAQQTPACPVAPPGSRAASMPGAMFTRPRPACHGRLRHADPLPCPMRRHPATDRVRKRNAMSADLSATTSARRAAMVERLETEGVLTGSRLREALLSVPREALLPHAYVRVSDPGVEPIEWRLLDGAHPDDREEWLGLIHSGESVLLQRDGERLDTLTRGPVTGGNMTSMSTYGQATVEALQTLQLGPGQRYLEFGPGPGVSLALAAAVTGPRLAVGIERDGHMAAFAQHSLDRLGLGATVVEGDALDGHRAGGAFDRIHSGIGVPCVPPAWVELLATDGRLLTTLTTRTPSWPGQLLVTRTGAGGVEAVLRGRPRGYRPMLGYRWLNVVPMRPRIKAEPGVPRPTRLAPPPDDAYGFWLAAAYLAPGLVRDFQAETMTIAAPDEDSWAVAGPGEDTVRVHGTRDVWAELEDVHARWVLAGRPDTYRVTVPEGGGAQHVASGPGSRALAWVLPPLAPVPHQTTTPCLPEHRTEKAL